MEGLEDETEFVAAQAGQGVFAKLCVIDAIEDQPPGIGAVQPGDQVEQGGLADARFADDRHVFARLQAQRDILKHAAAAELAREAGDFKQAGHPARPAPPIQRPVGGTRAR